MAMARFQRNSRQIRPAGFFAGLFAIGAAMLGLSAVAQNTAAPAAKEGVILTLNGPVSPPAADYLAREIAAASDAGKELIIIEIDTPGGLMDSMKTIIKAILASETPVATYVSPQGARSASAGLYIMYSAHISAMAPATNTGAATPIEIGGAPSDKKPLEDKKPDDDPSKATNPEPASGGKPAEENEDTRTDAPEPLKDSKRDTVAPLSSDNALRAKVINDSVAYIRALAEERGRNADWAEAAVREAVSVTANQALELGVFDLIADDIDDLLTQIDGRTVATAAGDKVIASADIKLERIEPTVVEKILGFIANPNVAVILMSLGTTGIIIEMWNPGSIFPGVVGVVSLALMGIGAVLIVLEAYTPTFGVAGLTGLTLFGVGMYFLFPESLRVSPSVIGTILGVTGALLGLIFYALVASRSHGPMIGADAIRKREGVVDEWDGKEGWVIVEGERWRARGDKPLQPGDKVRVVEVDGLVLVVKQAKAGGLLGGLQPSQA